jgi:hypothetical protein
VVCDLSSALYTDKKEYLLGIDSQALISLHITDVQWNPLDVDSVVIDVNGDSIAARKSSPGLYTATYSLSKRTQGVYVVTASIFKRDYPDETKTAAFKIIIPVTISLSTDREEYAMGDDCMVRAEVRDASLNGVSGLHFDLSVADLLIPFVDKGGGIYEAQVALLDFPPGECYLDITNMEQYIRVDRVYGETFRVGGLPELLFLMPEQIEVSEGSVTDISVQLSNEGEGDATTLMLSLETPPGVDILALSGYAPTIPPGGQSEAFISVRGIEEGEYSLTLLASYEDVGGTQHTTSHTVSVLVTSSMSLSVFLVIGILVVGSVAIGFLLRTRGTDTREKSSSD